MSIFGDLQKAGIEVAGPDSTIKFHNQMQALGGISQNMANGNVYYCDPANGSDNYSGKSPGKAVASLDTAYGKTTADQHDVVVLIGGDTSASLTEQLDWSKDYVHLIGIAAPTYNCRAKISCSSGLTANQGALKLSGTGNIISNIRLFEGNDLATAHAFEVTGQRILIDNCTILGKSHATSAAGSASSSLFLNGAEEIRIRNSWIGLDTVKRTDGPIILIDSDCKRISFESCFIQSYCETAAKALVKLADANALDRWMLFKDTTFYNFYANHGGNLSEVFTIPAACQTHDIILKGCTAVGITEWESNDRGSIWINTDTPTAEDGGIAVEPINS